MVFHKDILFFPGSYLLSGGHECVLVKWHQQTEYQDFLPRLGAPITHITSSPDNQYYSISQDDNGRLFISLPDNPSFYLTPRQKTLKTLWVKEKMLVTSIFSFTHNVFYPVKYRFCRLSRHEIVICKCFQFGQV